MSSNTSTNAQASVQANAVVAPTPALEGGRKSSKSKSAAKSSSKSVSSKSQSSKGGEAKKTAKSAAKSSAKKSVKKGGFIADDIKNLAVPFAILLAKQGLTNMFDKKKQESKAKTPSPSKPSSIQRRKSVSGGSASVEVRENFDSIAKQINNFLKKY
jgi:hypothetical protein